MPIARPYIKRLSDGEVCEFLTVEPRNPNTLMPVIEPIDRPNVDGLSFRRLGRKARPWSAVCTRDFRTVYDARVAAQQLRDGIQGQMCEVWVPSGSGWVGYGRMMCLEVIEAGVQAIASPSNGLALTTLGTAIIVPYGAATGSPAVATFEIVFVNAGPEST